jgi:hypothetical protein
VQKVIRHSEGPGGADVDKDFFIFVVNIMIPGPPFICMVRGARGGRMGERETLTRGRERESEREQISKRKTHDPTIVLFLH